MYPVDESVDGAVATSWFLVTRLEWEWRIAMHPFRVVQMVQDLFWKQIDS